MPFLFPVPLVFGLLALRAIKGNRQYVGQGRASFAIAWVVIGLLLTLLVLAVLLSQ